MEEDRSPTIRRRFYWINEQVVKPVVSVYPAASRAHLEGKSSLLCLASAMFPPLVKFSWKRQKEDGPLEEVHRDVGEQLELRESGRTASILLIHGHESSTYKYRCSVQHEGGTVEAQTEQEVPAPAASCPPEREPADLPALQQADCFAASRLVEEAFPTYGPNAKDGETCGRFIAGIEAHLQLRCHEHAVTTLESALGFAQQIENAHQASTASCLHLQILCRVFLKHLSHLSHLSSLPWHPLTFLHLQLLSVSVLPPRMISEKCRGHWRHFEKELNSYSWRCNASDKTRAVAHRTTDPISRVPLLIADEATSATTPQTGTTTETLPTIHTQLVILPTDLQSMKGTGTTDGIPTLGLDRLSDMHVVPAHHPETTRGVAALLNAMRTDISLIALQVLDVYASILVPLETV
ncbi:hypothetical protein D5F01_LYC10038 [Larimichthys crocea]|uniref:Ig-like domain-containing protein n=1 Tax=Larimichthys crocea TaxID=215358 RepID=A0A6G0IG33_LARCR|nr:hypothetical protein D5F01_LYC10038 [Larimichthys crocea]